ncbi:hypothetical protein BZM26_09180 [Paraburkholderia strydomiana]|nr:hypothetical protein BZM26_09180 [Paraburkholderia strydomiana]
MPPDACSRRRKRKALRTPRFPILTFDEWQLRLALGSEFNIAWLVPGESLVSILWKFACANALPGDVLLRMMSPDVDPREGVAPRRDAIDIALLRHLVRLPRKVLDASLIDSTVHERYHTVFRYCRQCAAHGYHSVLHQLEEEDHCPAHRQPLLTRCPQCMRDSPFIISSNAIDAPFRCVWCRSHFSYGRLSIPSTTPAMCRRDRLAIRRQVLLRLGSDARGVSNG